MTRRVIVYVAPRVPYPLTSGMAIRQFYLLSAYAELGQVRLVFFYEDQAELLYADALRSYCDSLHPIPIRTMCAASPAPSWRKRFRQIATFKPSFATLYYSEPMQQAIYALSRSADLIHVCRLQMVPQIGALLANRLHRQRFVLDLDDVETVARARQLAVASSERWSSLMLAYLDLGRLWLYERRAVRSFDRVFVCSDRDQRRFRDAKVTVIPNGAALSEAIGQGESDGKTILYCGTLSWQPNIDGLFFFLRTIFPLIRKAVPGVRLLIVGKSPPQAIRALHDGSAVFVEGDVATLEPYYRQSALLAVPLRMGGGTRLKVLEALAFGTPVVSTSVGCEGLDVVDREHLLIADDPWQFAQSCVELLGSADLRARLIANGRRLVTARYTWDSIRTHLKETVITLLEGSG